MRNFILRELFPYVIEIFSDPLNEQKVDKQQSAIVSELKSINASLSHVI